MAFIWCRCDIWGVKKKRHSQEFFSSTKATGGAGGQCEVQQAQGVCPGFVGCTVGGGTAAGGAGWRPGERTVSAFIVLLQSFSFIKKKMVSLKPTKTFIGNVCLDDSPHRCFSRLRLAYRDIGGSDPERMAAPRVAEYVQELFSNSPVKVEWTHCGMSANEATSCHFRVGCEASTGRPSRIAWSS